MLSLAHIGRDDLNVGHARLAGWRSGRRGFLQQLERLRVGSLALASDEILYVPRLQLRSVAGERLADAAFESLRDMAAAAQLDPAPGAAGHLSCRFSSRARYLAWLVGLWLGGPREREVVVAATGALSLGEWQRREMLRHGPLLVSVTNHLVIAGLAAEWIGRFEPQDYVLAEAAIAGSFGIELGQGESRPPPDPPTQTEVHWAGRRSQQGGIAIERTGVGAVIIALSRELTGRGNEWRKLPSCGRRLLLSVAALASLPAPRSRQAFAAAVLAIADGEPDSAREASGVAVQPQRRPASHAPAQAQKAPLAPHIPKPGTSAWASSTPSTVPASPGSAEARTPAGGEPASTADTSPGSLGKRTCTPDIAIGLGIAFQSDYAGLLFLLNAFTALGLYPDFASTGPPRLAVSPLWLIDRVGCFWFGRRYRRDPLHGWIVANSRGGQLPREWSLDPAWSWRWKAGERPFVVERGARITFWHPRGFPVEDIAASFRPRTTRHSRRRSIYRRRRRVPQLPAERNERWVACLSYFLDARIRLATGNPSVGLHALAQSGELAIDELDVTARFSFEPQTVPLRLAGLDRDPCWQPAEGRSFRFHFS